MAVHSFTNIKESVS